jgi:hypothetical protein
LVAKISVDHCINERERALSKIRETSHHGVRN